MGEDAAGSVAGKETLTTAESVATDETQGAGGTVTPIGRGGRRSAHPVVWFIAGALAVIAINTMRLGDGGGFSLEGTALGQAITGGGSRGVFAFTGQLAKNSYGVYMVDMDAMTIWVYEYQARKGCLRLASARTWRYDRYLEDYNLCDLPPDAVEQLIEDQRRYRLEAAEEELP